jgi:hypothetical protein
MLVDSSYWSLFGIVAAAAAFVALVLVVVIPRLSSRWKTLKQQELLAEEYERSVAIRQDAVYHFYWAVDRGDTCEANAHEKTVLEIDERLAVIRREYSRIG